MTHDSKIADLPIMKKMDDSELEMYKKHIHIYIYIYIYIL